MDRPSDDGNKSPRERHTCEALGVFHDVGFEVQTGSFVTILAELCIVGLFTRQAELMHSGGALSDLERVLKGAIGALRKDSLFRGDLGDKMLLSSPPPPISARAILLIGLGEPDAWNPPAAQNVAAIAMREALRLGVKSAAFAPCLKECGLDATASAGTAAAMLAGARKALKSLPALAPKPALQRWIFAESLEWIDVTIDRLKAAAVDTDVA